MSTRRQIVAALSEDSYGGIATLSDVDHAEQLVDAHRAEVLAKAIGRLRAIPVDCTALTGPVWYGDGWNSAITCLEEIAEYQVPDDEAYPGELQRLRILALQVRVAALRKEDLSEAQRLLLGHAEHERTARAAAKDKATATAATPSAVARQADLLTAIRAYGGRWKSGRAAKALGELGHTVGKSTAGSDLARLAEAGHLTRHDTPGVTFYTLRKDNA
jgi:hypothetical protein